MAEGILNVLKPPGMTSHDVISFLRRTLNTKKIGHAGTLDPDAAGVLPVFVGQATRLLEYVADDTKCYRVELRFGHKTDTGDDSGSVISSSDIFRPGLKQLEVTLSQFIGKIEQIPPMYSAVRYEGKKLYQLARAGIEVERKPRSVTIYNLELIHQSDETIILDVECSKGTYIRTLVEDIAESLGMCGTVSFLLRTKAGRFTIDTAKTLEEIAEAPHEYLLPSELATEHFPELILTDNQAVRISQGVLTSVSGVADGKYRLKSMAGQFIGIGSTMNGKVKADKVISVFTPILEVNFMKIIHNFYEPEIDSSPCVIALGTFDGLHLGHCDVIREAHVYAKQHNLKLLVFTFSNHPLSEIKPDDVPDKLITNEEKESILENLGVDILVNIPFTHYFSQLSPTDFLQKLKVFSYKCLVVGANYNYGFKGEGNTTTLIEAGKNDGFEVVVRNLVTIEETVVSSSNIRKLIQAGEVGKANKMLGREYSIKGLVVPGSNRGNCLGFPTANLELTDIDLVIPAKGVYAARVVIDCREYIGMVNIGYSPTFGDIDKKRLEINIFDFANDIYGKNILVKLVAFVRGERKFDSSYELCLQLQRDKNTVLNYFQS